MHPEDKESDADPDDAFEAGELCAEFAGGVFLGCAEFGVGTGFFALAN